MRSSSAALMATASASTSDTPRTGQLLQEATAALPSLRRGAFASALQLGLRGLWDLVLPALFAAVVMRFFVPSAGTGWAGELAYAGRSVPGALYAGLFVAFAALLRYWRFGLPGGRYASSLPAHAAASERDGARLAMWAEAAARYELLRSPSGQRWRARSVAPTASAEIDARLRALWAAIEAGDGGRASAESAGLAELAAPFLAARRRRGVLTTIGAVAIAAAAALVLRAQFVESYIVLSGSMLPTLEPDDRIAGSKVAYRAPFAGRATRVPSRGDVIVFRTSTVAMGVRPGLPDVLVKRVIGLPGDRITMAGGTPVINGWRVPSCDAGDYLYVGPDGEGRSFAARVRVEFLDDQAYLTVQAAMPPFASAYVVKPNEVFVLGDNRSNSVDSRAYNEGRGGGVPLVGIDARAQWFLVGRHRSGDADFGRWMHAIDDRQVRFRAEGLDERAVHEGIAKCMANRPSETHPPAADAGAAGDAPQGGAR